MNGNTRRKGKRKEREVERWKMVREGKTRKEE